jgi:hypothetical protein
MMTKKYVYPHLVILYLLKLHQTYGNHYQKLLCSYLYTDRLKRNLTMKDEDGSTVKLNGTSQVDDDNLMIDYKLPFSATSWSSSVVNL